MGAALEEAKRWLSDAEVGDPKSESYALTAIGWALIDVGQRLDGIERALRRKG